MEISTWADVWSEAVAVNEMCVKNGKSGNGKAQSKCNIREKAHSLPISYCFAFLSSQHGFPPLLVGIDKFTNIQSE